MENKMKFEDKVKELEIIIDELENGTVPLEESIQKYTKAMTLVKECEDELETIEKQVNRMVNENGQLEEFNTENI